MKITCGICSNRPECFPTKTNKHRHKWVLLRGIRTKRHCFGCNTTHELVSATKWEICETARFGINHKNSKYCPLEDKEAGDADR